MGLETFPESLIPEARRILSDAAASGRVAPVPPGVFEEVHLPLAAHIAARAQSHDGCLVVSLSGTAGAGKSTTSASLQLLLEGCFGLRAAGFSLDDVYLSRAERMRLARDVHPLLATRGPPGTHELALVRAKVASLCSATSHALTTLPRFSKLSDDRVAESQWPRVKGRPDVLILDNWFWHVVPPTDAELSTPINQREAEEDPDGTWRRWARDALARDYPPVFALSDYWIELRPPSFDATVRFREDQQRSNEAHLSDSERTKLSGAPPVRYFLELFQRWGALPTTRAPDLRVRWNDDHSLAGIDAPPPGGAQALGAEHG